MDCQKPHLHLNRRQLPREQRATKNGPPQSSANLQVPTFTQGAAPIRALSCNLGGFSTQEPHARTYPPERNLWTLICWASRPALLRN